MDENFLRGKQLQAEGRLWEALDAYGSVAADSLDYFKAQNNLGSVLEALEQFEPAVAAYERALAVAPRSDIIHYNHGHALQRLGRLQEAVNAYRQAYIINPASLETCVNLGIALQEQLRHESAAAMFALALEIDPTCRAAHSCLGLARYDLGHIEEALAAYETALALDPHDGMALYNVGRMCDSLRRWDEAERHYRQAVAALPQAASAHEALVRLLADRGRAADAADALRHWQRELPDDPAAAHLAAACGLAETPLRASDDYIRSVFDNFSADFDSQVAKLKYRGPALAVEALRAACGEPPQTLDVLDAGCGTGLAGSLLRPFAKKLVGVDLSAGMLQKARARGVYDKLVEAELTSFLNESPALFDAIVAVDTLVYFGDLEPVLQAIAAALRPGGSAVISLERAEEGSPRGGYHLQMHGRFSHTEQYAAAAIAQAGLTLVAIDSQTLRTEGGSPVKGLILTARSTQ